MNQMSNRRELTPDQRRAKIERDRRRRRDHNVLTIIYSYEFLFCFPHDLWSLVNTTTTYLSSFVSVFAIEDGVWETAKRGGRVAGLIGVAEKWK